MKKKIKYWSTENILSKEALWNMIFGKRSNGKSYAIKKYIVEDALKYEQEEINKHRFFYLRRYDADVSIFQVTKYLEDTPIAEISKGRFNSFNVAKNKIWAVKRDTEGNITDKCHIGYYNNIGNAERLKSSSYLDVNNLVFEEFIASSKPYLSNECELLENIVSTIARNRKIKVFMIGNNDSRDCIYFRYFGLHNILRQKEGTIEVYEKESGTYDENDEPIFVKFAVEFCGNEVAKSGMFFGKGAQINDTGDWKADLQPKMSNNEFEESEKIYNVLFDYHNLKYMGYLCQDKKNNGFFWYVRPFNNNRRIFQNTRIISDLVSTNPLSTCNLEPLNKGELLAFDILKNGKIFFCDDLTGTEFKRAINFFINNKNLT